MPSQAHKIQEIQEVKVLIVEDDEDDFFITRRLLSNTPTFDCIVDWAHEYEEGLEALAENDFDIALIDYRLGPRDGLELLREALAGGASASMILLTGQGDLEVDLQAMAAGASDYLIKGEVDAPMIERTIRYAIDRKRAYQRIQEQAALLDKARDAILEINPDGDIIYWNKGAERLTGWTLDEMAGECIDERLCKGENAVLAEAHSIVREQEEWAGELCMYGKNGEKLNMESRWTLMRDGGRGPRSILVISTNVTERKRLETQFLRSQRMDSIGRLVGGIAHDLGNLLAPITLGVKILKTRMKGQDDLTRTLDMIETSAERGSEMVRHVLAFARGVEGEREPFKPSEVLEEIARMTRETFPADISIETDFHDDGCWITGDSTQIQQVIMNLCVNARDAMPADGGSISLRVRQINFDEQMAQQNVEATPGSYACLSIKDSGEGIPPEIQDKIFEPFFTTKTAGKGTGLGLSTVYSIVKSHDGWIDVESTPERGTSFYVYLPLSSARANGQAAGGEPSDEVARADGETVLVVDDEDFVREMICDVLRESGYRVIGAENGKRALEEYDGNDVDLVLMDLMMPVMNGIEAIRKLRNRSADVPIVAASALSDEKPREALEAGADRFLSKPFTADTLCRALRQVLQATA